MRFIVIQFFTMCFSAFLLLPGALAQETRIPVCGTDEYYEARKKANPMLQKLEEEANEVAKNYKSSDKAKLKKDEDPRIVPVVFHVVHEGGEADIDKSRIMGNLKTVNEDFKKENADTTSVQEVFKDRIADYNIEFRPARVAPDGSCTEGITRTQSSLSTSEDRDAVKSLIRWNTDHYLNIWVVKNIGGDRPIAGFAQFPWQQNDDTDGIVILADEVEEGDRTLTHEIGHYLGLFHPFQGGCRTGNCENQNDQVCDVPPTERRRGIQPCSQIGNTCDDPSGEPDMKENFMDYTTCPAMFTEGQKQRSEPLIAQYRQELFSEENIIRTGVKQDIEGEAPLASFTADQTKICAGQEVVFDNLSCSGSPDNIEWTFEGANPSNSSAKNPSVTYPLPGEYDVKLRMSNANGADTLLKTDYIKVVEPLKAPIKFTFQENNLQAKGYDFTETAFGHQWKQTNNVGLSGNKSLYLGNFNIQEDGQNVAFNLPPVDITGIEDPVLRFDMAYATKSASSNDILKVAKSSDCGKTWQHLKFFFNNDIVTKSDVTSPFFPENSKEWKTHEYGIAQLKSSSNARLQFEMQTDQGNNVFIDNVRIEKESTSIGDQGFGPNEAFKLYPNPVDEVFEIEYTGNSKSRGVMTVANPMGKTIEERVVDFRPGEIRKFKTSTLNMNASGLYFIRIQYNDQTVIKKITLSE